VLSTFFRAATAGYCHSVCYSPHPTGVLAHCTVSLPCFILGRTPLPHLTSSERPAHMLLHDSPSESMSPHSELCLDDFIEAIIV
jgi:hypothetical protein